MELEADHIKKAYLYLKSYTYHENLNLFLKQRLAEFEESNIELDRIFGVIAGVVNAGDVAESEQFQEWLNDIDYHLLPKMVERSEDHKQNEHNKEKGLFISNVRDSEEYQVSKVNYFIKAPIEIHIIELLWCLYCGPALEDSMSKDSYGNRMHPSALKFAGSAGNITGQEIFRRYIDQYAHWRDQAIHIATEAAKNGDDVALLSLDLKSYFYHVDINFEKICGEIETHYENDSGLYLIALKLNNLLEEIYSNYRNVIATKIKQTHSECEAKSGLPIGFVSSAIIANWYLSDFDSCVGDKVRPEYYGRYVDDIIMVFKRPKFDINNPIQSFVTRYLDDVLKTAAGDSEYVLEVDGNCLPMQKDKLILQFFDKEHSRAGLEVFKQELDERSSAFRFLPSEHIEKELDRFAYDVLYDGSANKLRSIVGLAENETELAKYLSSHITAHRLCKIDKKETVIPQVKQFFKGQNALQFFRLWEKLYQYSIITRNYKFVEYFYRYIDSEIAKISVLLPKSKKPSPELTGKMFDDLRLHNQLSLALTIGLLDIKEAPSGLDVLLAEDDDPFFIGKRYLTKLVSYWSGLHIFAWQFRYANIIRHHLVAWPLANFSDHSGDLTSESDFVSNGSMRLDERKIEYSPRFIHFDEWQIFLLGKHLDSGGELNNWMTESINEYKEMFFGHDFCVSFNESKIENSNIIKSHLIVGGNDAKERLNLAVANLHIEENDIGAAVRKDSSPNVSFERQEKLYSILNAALFENADLLVMPEMAIPISWLPFMVAFSRRHQVALVFGLEHWVAKGVAYNLIIEALPFRMSGKYKSCTVTARVKNHYAPAELELLESVRLEPGNHGLEPNAFYHKVSWRGVSFSTYNCFELSDITHRVLFRSEIDLLLACVWNKDTNYYQHILESSVRDLHCYTVQANTSQYGGSCVLRPTKTESKTMLYVKGGENSCVLTTRLDIKGLREFQYKSKSNENDKFKHLPPGYDSDAVLAR